MTDISAPGHACGESTSGVDNVFMTRRKPSRRQLSLFEADQADLPFDAYAPPEPQPVARPGEQLPLFEGKVPLVGEVATAVLDADFVAARSAYDRLRESYPADEAVSSFEFLLSVPKDFWSGSRADDERLAMWRMVAQKHQGQAHAHRAAREGFFRRQLALTKASDLAVAHPWVASDVANQLLSMGEWRAARDVVRDVLLTGYELRPLAFEDGVVCDLLGEEGAPAWLASLGAIRSVWPRQSLEIENLEQVRTRLSTELPEGEHERALDFWFCLCVSGLGSRVDEELRYGAHRRMKQLHPALHEEFMSGRPVA